MTNVHSAKVKLWPLKIRWLLSRDFPPKTECGCPSGGGIKNGHIRYPPYGGTQKEKKSGDFQKMELKGFTLLSASAIVGFCHLKCIFESRLQVNMGCDCEL